MLASRNFDFPGELPANTRYVGTPIDDLNAVGTWSPPWSADDKRPLLLISLSTLAQGQAQVLDRCIQAAGDLPLRVLVTLGPSLTREDSESPANTLFESFVPHSAVLPHVFAVVTQCGLGTLTKTLRQGVPVICIPLLGDQPDNAARVEAKGAGIRLSPDATVTAIRSAIQEVISQAKYRERAQELSRLIAEDGTTGAANEIEAVASGLP
jgi:MGT family glycosyltransferase